MSTRNGCASTILFAVVMAILIAVAVALLYPRR